VLQQMNEDKALLYLMLLIVLTSARPKQQHVACCILWLCRCDATASSEHTSTEATTATPKSKLTGYAQNKHS
jgi:hypothetical protein